MSDAQVPDYSGRDIGNWRLLRRLGVGSFGAVYEAQNQSIDKQAAVKVLHPQWAINAEVVSRFLKEASAASRARHRGVVEFYDGGFSPDKLCYMVMELCHGQPLTRLLKSGPLGPVRTARLGSRLADALDAVHRQSVVHRDLKPDNILVEQDPRAGDIPKILDFGIAKLRAGPKQTVEGQMLGTPEYMSPEQCLTQPDIDHRADIYSLGVVLFECLTGQLPFVASNFYGYLLAHVNQAPPDPCLVRLDTPPALGQFLLRMLAKDPAQRPASMAEVHDAFDALAHGRLTTLERPDPPRPPAAAAAPSHHAPLAGTLPATLAPAGLTQPALAPTSAARTEVLDLSALPTPPAGTGPQRLTTLPPPPAPSGLRTVALASVGAALLLGIGTLALRSGKAPPVVAAAADLATSAPSHERENPRPPPAPPQPRPLPAELIAVQGRALSRAQITAGEFRAFAERAHLRPQAVSRWPWEMKVPENLPMINVPTYQAARYCQDRYHARGGRLPTAEELAQVRAVLPPAPKARPAEWLHEGSVGPGDFKTSFRCSAALEERATP